MNDKNDIKTEDDYDEEESYSDSSSSSDRDKIDAKKTMMRFMFIVIAVVILLAIVLLLASVFMKHKYTYDDLEDVLRTAAIAYFKDNKDQLPQAFLKFQLEQQQDQHHYIYALFLSYHLLILVIYHQLLQLL